MALPLLAIAAMAAPSLIGGVAAGITGKRAQKKYDKQMKAMLGEQRGDIDAIFKGDMNRNWMQSEQAQSVLQQMQQMMQQNQARTRGVAARGGTVESQVAQQGAGNQQYADILNRLFGQATNYRQDARNRYMSAMDQLFGRQAGHASHNLGAGMQRAGYYAQAGQQMSEGMKDLAPLLMGG